MCPVIAKLLPESIHQHWVVKKSHGNTNSLGSCKSASFWSGKHAPENVVIFQEVKKALKLLGTCSIIQIIWLTSLNVTHLHYLLPVWINIQNWHPLLPWRLGAVFQMRTHPCLWPTTYQQRIWTFLRSVCHAQSCSWDTMAASLLYHYYHARSLCTADDQGAWGWEH